MSGETSHPTGALQKRKKLLHNSPHCDFWGEMKCGKIANIFIEL